MENFIEIEAVSKTFVEKGLTVQALDEVGFSVAENEFVSLIGPSGCGKTTLLSLVGDLVEPTKGNIRVMGGSPADARRQRQFGFVFQDPTLLPWRTVIDNIGLPLEIISAGADRLAKVPLELVKLVGLEGFEHHYPDQLSGGMQQRVSIARALSFEPSILLMDEPFGALDLITRDKMALGLLDIWEKKKKTVLFVTHSISEAVFLSDKVIVFSSRPAKVLEIVPIEFSRPRQPALRLTGEFLEYTKYLMGLLG